MKQKWESWHLHHLARRAKIFGIEKRFIDVLEKSGWFLTKSNDIPPNLKPVLEKAFKRLAEIKDFDKSCDIKNCPVCKKVTHYYSSGFNLRKSYTLQIEIYRWQKEAKQCWWNNNGKGIVKVVTGAGKTIFALSLISDLYNSVSYQDNGLTIIIIVPTSTLLDQWFVNLVEMLGVPENEIGVYYGQKKNSLSEKRFVLYVVNSARDHIGEHYQNFYKKSDIFLIADECHRYGSRENAKIFQLNYSYTLGLSATPERYGDTGFEKKIVPNLGKIIFSYSYNDALYDGVIPPYKLTIIKVNLTENEYHQYDDYSGQISKTINILLSRYPRLKGVKSDNFIKELNFFTAVRPFNF